MKKQNDLQWLRALAVFAVVGFHLMPEKFPHGYLGVDIFFVISGYLMTAILSENIDVLHFYICRIKRIFPTFIFTVAALFIFAYFTFLSLDFKFLKDEVLWSILFVNNLYPIIHKQQYFELIGEYKFLLHTWSLGVEIQYYLMAPFLLKFLLSKNHKLYWTLFFVLLSIAFQHLINDEAIAFGFVLCRIWQFLFGTMAFLLSQQQQHNFLNVTIITKLSAITLICLFIICFNNNLSSAFHQKIFSSVLCASSVIATSMFIISNTWSPLSLPSPLNILLVYIGDASYVIYLIHWPIILLLKYFSISLNSFVVIIIILAFTLPIHYVFAYFVAKFNTKQTFCFIFFFYTIVIVLCCANNASREPQRNPIYENEKAAELCPNLYYNDCDTDPMLINFSKIVIFWPNPVKFCLYKLNPNAKKVVIIIGNSYAYFQNRGLLEAVKEAKTKFNKAYYITLPACSFIVGRFNKKFKCNGYFEVLSNFLAATKPDIIINSARISLLIPRYISVTNITDGDKYLQEFKKNILNVANYTSKLIILQPNPFFPKNLKSTIGSPLTVAQALRKNQTTTQFNITTEMYHRINDPSWIRVEMATKACSNCIIVSTEHLFCNKDICPMVDQKTQISMYCDNNHLTAEKSLALKPDLIRAIDMRLDLSVNKNSRI